MKPSFNKMFYLLPATLLLASCFHSSGTNTVSGIVAIPCTELASVAPPVETVPDFSNDRITITNNDNTLSGMITCMEVNLSIDDGLNSLVGHKVDTNFELDLVAEVEPPTIVGKAVALKLLTLNDMSANGTYNGTETFVRYRVEIDSVGATDTFKWSEDFGTTWAETNVDITGSAQALSNGVTITFNATTNHALTDDWGVDAGILQATSVAMKDKRIVVTYNMIGAPYLGAIQVYNKFDGGFPLLKSQALFRDTDINAVSISHELNGDDIYVVGASEPGTFTDPAVIETMELDGSKLTLNANSRLRLSSFAATSATYDETTNKVFTTSGSAGGLTVIDVATSTMTIDSTTALADARWASFEEDTSTLVVAQGGVTTGVNGQISVFNIDINGIPTLQISNGFTGADIAESKTTVEVTGGKAIIAAGSGGVQILNTTTGAVITTIDNPSNTGLTAGLVVANAVTVDEDMMFISNGEAGIYVAQAIEDFSSNPSVALDIKLLGQLQFDSLQSANHVAYKGKYLFIAAGLGGLKIIRLTPPS